MTPRTARPARRACSARRAASAGCAATAGEADARRRSAPRRCRPPQRLRRSSSESTATVTRAPRVASSASAARRFRSSSSLASSRSCAEPGAGHAHELACRRAAEGGVPGGGQLAGQRGGLERLHVRTQRGAGSHGCHGRHVVLERLGVDHQRGRGQVVDVHDRARYAAPWNFWGRFRRASRRKRPQNRWGILRGRGAGGGSRTLTGMDLNHVPLPIGLRRPEVLPGAASLPRHGQHAVHAAARPPRPGPRLLRSELGGLQPPPQRAHRLPRHRGQRPGRQPRHRTAAATSRARTPTRTSGSTSTRPAGRSRPAWPSTTPCSSSSPTSAPSAWVWAPRWASSCCAPGHRASASPCRTPGS